MPKENIKNDCTWLDPKEKGCRLSPLKDPETGDFLGYLSCSVLENCPSCERIKKQSKIKCPLNKVVYSFLWAWLVKDWADLYQKYTDDYSFRDVINYLLDLVSKDMANKGGKNDK